MTDIAREDFEEPAIDPATEKRLAQVAKVITPSYRREAREKLKRDTEAYLARGGKITPVASDVVKSLESIPMATPEQQKRAQANGMARRKARPKTTRQPRPEGLTKIQESTLKAIRENVVDGLINMTVLARKLDMTRSKLETRCWPLKDSYFKQAKLNLEAVGSRFEKKVEQKDMFGAA